MIDVKPKIMSPPILNKSVKHLCLLLVIGITTVAFSGCKSEGGGILGKQSLLSSDENPDILNAPFAYDMAADTISYNSCVMAPGTSSSEIHGLKIGSSEGFVDNLGTGTVKGGLKLRSDFLQYIGQKFTPDYPSTVVTPTQILRILSTSYSVQNANAYLNFAVRKKADYTVIPDQIVATNTTPAVPGRDAIVFPQTLSSGFLGYSITKGILYNAGGTVLAEGPRTYNLSDSVDAIPIEGTFAFNQTVDDTYTTTASGIATEPYGRAELYSQQVRDAFNSNVRILTATFGGTNSTSGVAADEATATDTINKIKRPYGSGSSTTFDQSKAFGRGYNLKFESPLSTTTWPKNKLTQVNEINLDTGTPTGGTSWSCEQFVIAHQSHWNNNKPKNPAWVKDSLNIEPNCAPLLADDTTCTGSDSTSQCNIKKDRAEKIKRIRRHYAVENWNIGILFPAAIRSGYTPPDRRSLEMCVSPKGATSCYLPTVGIVSTDSAADVGIQYNRLQDCYLTSSTPSDRDLARKNGRCAQYASVCVRTSSNY